jgi:hypothetical protein
LRQLVRWLPEGTTARTGLVIALAVVSGAVAVKGIRALSGDYMIRVTGIVQGGGGGRVKPRRSRLGDIAARLLGGPPARAGFAFTARLMRRDRAFRRQLVSMIPCVICPIAMLAEDIRANPFNGHFPIVHAIPHIFGLSVFLVATSIVYGGEHKGAWVFLLAPSGAFVGFARGVYGLLWTRGVYLFGIMLAGGVAIAVAVALQYLIVFRSMSLEAVVTAVVTMAAVLVTRTSLDAFTVTMRFNLGLVSEELGKLYTEVDA